jgi:hypothetical protein
LYGNRKNANVPGFKVEVQFSRVFIIYRLGCSEPVTFSGPGVQSGSYVIAKSLGDVAHARAFRQVPENEAVEVFNAAAFPRVVGSCELALQWKLIFKSLVTLELCAIVKGDGFEIIAVLSDSFQCRLGSRSSGSRRFLGKIPRESLEL